MKKTLSLILAILMIFSMTTLAFAAEGELTPLTKEEAKAKALAHVKYEEEIVIPLLPTVVTGTYNDTLQGTVEVYNITSTLLLYSGKTATYYTVVDKYDGQIYYQKATILNAQSIVEFTEELALSLALEVLGVNKDNTSVISKNIDNSNGKTIYHFVFVEGFSEKYECKVSKSDLVTVTVDDIKVSKYNEPGNTTSGISAIVERIVLAIKVLFAKLNPTNLLEKVSAADLLKIFQFLTK